MLHGKQLATGSTPTNRLNLGGTEGQMANFDSNQLVASSSLITASPTSLTIDGDMVVSDADIDVNGQLVQLDTETISFGDAIVEINTGGSSGNIGFSINRGSDDNTSFYYDQSSDVWKMDTMVAGVLSTRSILLEDVMVAADGVLSTALSGETARSAAARLAISTSLSAATASRIANDNQLTSIAGGQLSTINGWIGDANTDIANEAIRASEMEQAIKVKLTGQTAAAGVSEVDLMGLVDAQIIEAEGEEGDLSSAIAAASLSATTAENALSGDTMNQITAAKASELALSGSIDTEISRYTTEEGDLHTNAHGALVSYLDEEIRHDAELSVLDAHIQAKVASMRGDGVIKYWSDYTYALNTGNATIHKTFSTFTSSEYNSPDPSVNYTGHDSHDHIVTTRKTHVIPSGSGVTTGTYTITLDDTMWDFNSEVKIAINGLEISDDSYTWTFEGEQATGNSRPGLYGYKHSFNTAPVLKTVVIDVAALGYSLDAGDKITSTYNIYGNSTLAGMQTGEFGCNDGSYIGGDSNIEQNNPALCITQFIMTDKANLTLYAKSNLFQLYGGGYDISGLDIVNQATGVSVFSKAITDLTGEDTFSLSGLADGVYNLTVTHSGANAPNYTTMILGDGNTTFGGVTNTYQAAYPGVVSGLKSIIPFTINQTI